MDGDFGNFGITGFIKLLPFMPSFIKLKMTSIEEFLDNLFNNNELKEMLYRMFQNHRIDGCYATSFMHRKKPVTR